MLLIVQNRTLNEFVDGIAHLWFLLVIFECYLLFRLLDKVFESKQMVVVVLFVIAVYLLMCSRIYTGINFLCFDTFLQYFPYYLAGILFYKLDIVEIFSKKKAIALLVCSCIVWCICLKFGHFIKLFSLELLFSMLIVVAKCSQDDIIISSLDKYSMGIYIIHQPLLQELSLLPFVKNFRDTHYCMYPMVTFIFILIVSYLLTKQIKRTKLSLVLG